MVEVTTSAAAEETPKEVDKNVGEKKAIVEKTKTDEGKPKETNVTTETPKEEQKEEKKTTKEKAANVTPHGDHREEKLKKRLQTRIFIQLLAL